MELSIDLQLAHEDPDFTPEPAALKRYVTAALEGADYHEDAELTVRMTDRSSPMGLRIFTALRSGASAGRRARFALLFYIFDGFSAKFFAKKKDFLLFRRIY